MIEQPRAKLPPSPLARLRFARFKAAYQAAEAAGLSTSTWSRIELGLCWPNRDSVKRIADALGVQPIEVLAALWASGEGR